MIYLSGCITEEAEGIGFICTPRMGQTPPAGRVWAADNGRFSEPESYSDEGFVAWLRGLDPSLCLFATAPDVLGDHAATLELSLPMLPRIRAAGYRAAFVAQDGFDGAPWDELDAVFIGGTTEFKLGPQVPKIVAEARRRGKWAHMGRVNSYKRLRVAKIIGCQSADGTFLKYAPDHNTGRMQKWLSKLNRQPTIQFL